MSALVLLALVIIGLLVGFVAGLIGIGGGVLVVPFLYFFYAHPSWSGFELPTALHVTVAHATSLFVIMPTAARGTYSYAKAGMIAWRVALPIAVVATFSAVAGARLGIYLPASALKLGFGVFLILSALQLVLRAPSTQDRPLRTNTFAIAATGLLVGLLSGMMGVGGGVLALPLLLHVLHVDIKRAAATSLTIVGVAALSGALTYIISGWHAPVGAPGRLGYVHVAAGLPILVGSLLSVPWGARANQRLNVRALRYVFALLFMAMGIEFVAENVGVLSR